MATLEFQVLGPLVTWKRTATFGGRRITPKSQRAYQRKVSDAAFVAVVDAVRRWPRDARYAVDIVWVPSNRRRADVDNACKQILDACNGVVWGDDSQVDKLRISRWAADKSKPGVWVTIETL